MLCVLSVKSCGASSKTLGDAGQCEERDPHSLMAGREAAEAPLMGAVQIPGMGLSAHACVPLSVCVCQSRG